MEWRESELRDYLVRRRKELLATPLERVSGRAFLAEHTALIDEVVRGIYDLSWRHALATQPSHYDAECTRLALVATGGYGRSELNPHSDLDIAFVPSEEDNPFLDAATKEAFRLVVELFLDATDLQVGYAYRPLEDLAHLDHQTVAALLDARFIAGSTRLFSAFMDEFAQHVSVLGFVQEKVNERERSVRRGRSSVYALEPNLKDGAGGLRDLHSARWLAQALFHCPASQALPELVRQGIVTGDEVTELEAALELLWRLRTALHLHCHKKEDVLRAQHQPRLARAFGYVDARGLSATQQMLADLYRHGERGHAFFTRVSRRLLDGSLPLDANFRAVRHRIRLIHPAQVRERPGLLVKAFAYAQKYSLALDAEVEGIIAEARASPDDWLRWPEARASFLGILRYGYEVGATLQLMHEHGVLARLLPEFDALMTLAPGDPSHELTVGAHSLRAVDLLCAIPDDSREERTPLPDAFAEVQDFELLCLGVLLHDAGKSAPDGDHSKSGARLARCVGQRLGLEEARVHTLEKLVLHHLLLPRTSRLRDMDSPVTVRRVLERVEDKDTLKMLYLLSNVDTRAVGAGSYTALDLQALDELYLKTLAAFAEEGEFDAASRAASQRARVTRELRSLELSEETVRSLCARLPASYIINTPLPTVAHHLTLLDRVAQERVITDFWQSPRGDFTELTICAFDDPTPGLLSKVTGALFASDIDIQNARVHTVGSERPIVLDTLRLMRERRPLTARQTQRLDDLLHAVLAGNRSIPELLAEAGKPAHTIVRPERIDLVNHLSDEDTVVHVVAEDVPGLLYFITRALAEVGLDIHTAKIAGWAGMAEDAFYVTRRDGAAELRKVPDDDLVATAEHLRAALARAEAEP